MKADTRSSGAGPIGSVPLSPQEERVGIFPSWKWVYGTVVVYGVVMVLFLLILTRLLDFRAVP